MSTDHGESPYSLLPPGLSREGLLDLYRSLARAREVDRHLRGDPVSPFDVLPSFPSLAGLAAGWLLRKDAAGSGDLLGLGLHSSVAALAHGFSPRTLLRAYHGPPVVSPGRDSGGNWIDLPGGVLGPEAPPGVLLGVMAGAALAFRLRDEARVGLFMGGAAGSATGAWHEGLNFAAVQKAPLVVMVLSRPGDASPSPGRTAGGASPPARRGVPYGIESTSVRGDDLPGALEAVSAALDRARSGGGVSLIEVSTPPGTGLDDPTAAFRSRLGALDPDMMEEISAIDAAARSEMEAVALDLAGTPADPASLPPRSPFHRPVPRVSPLAGS